MPSIMPIHRTRLQTMRGARRAARDVVIFDVPEGVDAVIAKLDFSFVERTNPTLYNRFPDKLLPDLARRLYQLGLGLHGEADWKEFDILRQAFATHYPEVAR
ncbi:hypothetical protein [Kocuria sp. CPCC 205297]|uniref:hypothetical protein n=1 Tax=Kocuria sp. CPCC 205297 TaxID=3073558 RepID=UPI0034D618D1